MECLIWFKSNMDTVGLVWFVFCRILYKYWIRPYQLMATLHIRSLVRFVNMLSFKRFCCCIVMRIKSTIMVFNQVYSWHTFIPYFKLPFSWWTSYVYVTKKCETCISVGYIPVLKGVQLALTQRLYHLLFNICVYIT